MLASLGTSSSSSLEWHHLFLMSQSLFFRILLKSYLPQKHFRIETISSNKLTGNNNIIRLAKMTTTSPDIIEICKELAARRAVDENINCDCVVGIGSGSTMTYVLSRIVERCKDKSLSIKCIPTSFQSKQLIYDYHLPITEIDCHPIIDVTIDGADEVDENLVAIKGGGACLAQEKVVAAAAKKFVVVADYRKDSKSLGDNWKKGIPIEVLPMAVNFVRHKISEMLDVPIDDVLVRIGKEKAGPVITDNGNIILDWKFRSELSACKTGAAWKTLTDNIKLIPGVVETGIFVDIIKEVYFGQPNWTVIKRTPK